MLKIYFFGFILGMGLILAACGKDEQVATPPPAPITTPQNPTTPPQPTAQNPNQNPQGNCYQDPDDCCDGGWYPQGNYGYYNGNWYGYGYGYGYYSVKKK